MSTVLHEYRERLRAGENPYLELVTSLFAAAQGGAEIGLDERRRELASLFSWAVVSRNLMTPRNSCTFSAARVMWYSAPSLTTRRATLRQTLPISRSRFRTPASRV